MYYRDLSYCVVKLNNPRAMRLPRAMFRYRFSFAVFTILVVSTISARADHVTSSKPSPHSARTERLVLTPANLRFGKVAIGRRNVKTVTITNSSNSSITLSQVTTQGKDFTLSGLDLPLTLASGERFTFNGIFAPRSHGDISGTVSFLSDASGVANSPLTLELTGSGTDGGQLTVDPAVMDFGKVLVGSIASQMGTLTASGEAVTVFSANSSSPEFTLSGLSFPFTIPAGGIQEYTVTFAPQDSGAVFATLSFLSDAWNNPTVQSLTGTAATAQHSVDLSWNASTSQDVIGYYVYRGTTSGGPYQKINSALDAGTTYTDVSVSDGGTYYYVATSVNSSYQESAYSNEAQAIIPADDAGIRRHGRSPAFSRKISSLVPFRFIIE
jgi:Abnormal spindle-like microcephaly-assoc'd, ASPM-SPD-2-Hydin